MNPKDISAMKSSMRFAVFAAVATLGSIASTQAEQSVTLRPSIPKALQAKGAGVPLDAIFRNGFGSSVLSLSLANPQPNLVDGRFQI